MFALALCVIDMFMLFSSVELKNTSDEPMMLNERTPSVCLMYGSFLKFMAIEFPAKAKPRLGLGMYIALDEAEIIGWTKKVAFPVSQGERQAGLKFTTALADLDIALLL